jgi:amino acid adenylation domain-containing protein
MTPGDRLEGLFVAQARRTPDAPAVLHRGRRVTYAELDRLSDAIARRLLALGAGPGRFVGLHLQRSPAMIASVLGVLKAGAAYLALDPAYPHERLALILNDADPAMVIADAPLDPQLGYAGPVLSPDEATPSAADAGPARPEPSPSDPAYVIYTSGSTGAPKGVVLAHTAVGFVRWAEQTFRRGELARVAATTSLCFDPSVFELFAPLSTGGAVILKQDALEPFAADEQPTLLNCVPSAMAALCRSGGVPDSVIAVNVGGEVLTAALAREIYRRTAVKAVYNHYGPTEATTCATVALALPDSVEDPPIGRPIAGAEIHVLDASGRPTPAGGVGEIHIGGPGLALGYLNRPDLTAERFAEDLLGPGSGRLYRTGDLGRWTADGQLQFIGRKDDQVKIRGVRIELGEIEATLAAVPGVRTAAAVVCAGPGGRPDLAAFAETDGVDAEALRAALAHRLPAAVRPRRVVVLDALPLTLTGKVDRQALADGLRRQDDAALQPVATDCRIEEAIAELFKDLLRRPVGPEESFFDLGGDSLLAVDAALRIEEVFGLAAPSALLHQAPTPRLLADALRMCEPSPTPLALLRPGDDALSPVICLADLFGRPISYLSLARRLAPGRAVWGLSPGPLEARFAETADLAVLSEGLLSALEHLQPRGPYVLAGYSAGGLPAFDLARRLRARGAEVRLVLLDSARRHAPSLVALARTLTAEPAHGLRSRVGRAGRALAALGGRWGHGEPRLPDWLPPEKHAYAAALAEAHRRRGDQTFDGPTLVIRCLERDASDDLLDPDGLLGWGKALKGPVRQRSAEGNHHSFMRDPRVAAVARTIDLWLDSAADGAARPAA